MVTCYANECYNSTNYSRFSYCSYHEKCLSKLREHRSIDDIQEIETFETWFNGNCGYVINHDSSYFFIFFDWQREELKERTKENSFWAFFNI